NGTPVITFDSGGAAEAVLDRESGFIVPRRDLNKLYESVIYILTDEVRANKMGRKAREWAFNQFSAEKEAVKMLNILKKVFLSNLNR
uniref:glycosyltransferase n=1 Tax=Candidatus Borrarchaeum sp. TaxID=2846742 RepID=UPI00257997ED